MADTTAGEGLPNKHVVNHPDAYLNALLDYTGGFYGAAREAGLPAKTCADAMQHVESAARGLHRLALAAQPSAGAQGEADNFSDWRNLGWFSGFARRHGHHVQADWLDQQRIALLATPLDEARLRELRERALAATPGPWRWEISLSSKQVALCGGPPKSGFGAYDHDVMSFRRWGMGGAAPVFWSWNGHVGHPKRADEVAVPVEGREHHASWFRTLDDPNAAFIAAANPATILALLDALSAERERGDRASK